jgi:membrane-associated phospholipid phosphatase
MENRVLYNIGYHGPNTLLALIILMIIIIEKKVSYSLIGIVITWQICSHILNITIKNILKYPRPDSGKDPIFSTLVPSVSNFLTIHKNFGMPSGHAQSVLSELTFLILYFKNPFITSISGIQTIITIWQRYITRRHSPIQLFFGGVLGVIIGIVFYKICPPHIGMVRL